MSNLKQRLTEEEWSALEESLIGKKQPYERFPVDDEHKERKDPIVELVVEKFRHRSKVGIKKYGTTLQDNNLTIYEWLTHLEEEQMDSILYIQKLKQEFKNM